MLKRKLKMLLEIARILDCLVTDLYHKEDLDLISK